MFKLDSLSHDQLRRFSDVLLKTTIPECMYYYLDLLPLLLDPLQTIPPQPASFPIPLLSIHMHVCTLQCVQRSRCNNKLMLKSLSPQSLHSISIPP